MKLDNAVLSCSSYRTSSFLYFHSADNLLQHLSLILTCKTKLKFNLFIHDAPKQIGLLSRHLLQELIPNQSYKKMWIFVLQFCMKIRDFQLQNVKK